MDEQVHVITSRDKLEASIIFSAPDIEGSKLTLPLVLLALEKAKITYGIDRERLEEVFNKRQYEKEYVIAEGKYPRDGQDGVVLYTHLFTENKKPKLDAKGNVDYLNVDNYISVKAGDVLATYEPPTKGESGINIFGNIVKAKDGKNVRFSGGKNIKISEDGLTMIATVDGLLEQISGTLGVSPVLQINSDVNLATGNIDFIGAVRIRGSVATGMKVVAKGSVEINGMVEGAFIESEGDIIVNGGIKGMGKAVLKAQGRVVARYIENASIYANDSVNSSSIIQSIVESQNVVEVMGQRSSIIGGSIKATNAVICRNLGSANHTPTVVEVGFTPGLRRRLRELEVITQKLTTEVANLDKVSKIESSSLSPQQKIIKERLLEEKRNKEDELYRLNQEKQGIQQHMEMNQRSFVSVHDNTYGGVTITINSEKMVVTTPYKFTTFRILEDIIAITQYVENLPFERSAGEV